MSEHLEVREAAELHRAESQWLDQCAARLRRALDEPAPRRDRPEPTATPEVVR